MSSMTWNILTLFPDIVSVYIQTGIVGRALNQGRITVGIHDIRDDTDDKHRTADDYPYGGGAGMVLKPEPIFRAMDRIREKEPGAKVLLMSPQGKPFNHETAKRLSAVPSLTLVCGRYEGVDERVIEHLVEEEISIGDYVISGGELAALVVLDAVSRFVPGVVGDEQSVASDSFSQGILKHPQYTRPENFRRMKVPDILLSGHHEQIQQYQRFKALEKTFRCRPDLLEKAELSESDQEMLNRIRQEQFTRS